MISADWKATTFQWSWNYERKRLNKYVKKENLKKDLMNLIQTNNQINMASDHSVFTNNSLKNYLNAKRFNMFLTL